jgi:hypothetical protein
LVGTGGIIFATSTDHLSTSAQPPRDWMSDPTDFAIARAKQLRQAHTNIPIDGGSLS